MGINIHLAISKSVTREEWKAVYEESLKLVKAFPLADKRTISVDGIETCCLVRSDEYEWEAGWNDSEPKVGWCAYGDYERLRMAEPFVLHRDIIDDNEYREDCEDALFGVLPAYLNYSWDDYRFDCNYSLWGCKTQGEPYHMYLLAIACMICARLGRKAFFYGDITAGQCLKAVKMANIFLETPIGKPDSCDVEKLMLRIDTMPLTESEKISVLESFFLGNKGNEFGEQIRKYFSPEAINQYWKKRFSYYSVDQFGFDGVFVDYVLWGFDFSRICECVRFENREGVANHESFVKRVMDAKLHLLEKDCFDPLKIDQDNESPYSIYTYMAQTLFAGSRNKKIDRYIPIEEIREVLKKGIGDKCDVDGIIDEYLKEESEQKPMNLSELKTMNDFFEAHRTDAASLFRQFVDKRADEIQEVQKAYDVAEHKDLLFYKTGGTIAPAIKKSLEGFIELYHSVLGEERYKELMKDTAQRRCEFLAESNRSVLIRDRDWQTIFKNIRENKESFARYYPMIRLRAESDAARDAIRGIVISDALYAFCQETQI